ncbi:anti-sigma factor family protein [Nocardia sp. alder85J]|uniref:anti-sigma factor family protein n=1 Tax=Nocardia sp. alder85J TaxID=2862949 RepID=UPI001CD46C52|nr:zf-HC2 domain-containing protein [Nocardia sp. alder85J]MCX4096342.1 zf-HC2 domain-containing protein [Nocardia sp. alder85J]
MTDTTPAADPESGDRYTMWDGPYLLGALGRSDRLEYEEHLTECPQCRAAVADLAGVPGLLGRVDAEVALALLDPVPEPEPAAEPEPVAATPPPLVIPIPAPARRRRRPVLAVTGMVVAAAAAVAIAVPITATMTERAAPPATAQVVAERQMNPVVATPVSASFKVIDAHGKATLEMSCNYAAGGAPYQVAFELWLNEQSGPPQRLAGWWAGPGDALTLSRTTDLAPDLVRSVEIRAAGGQTILVGTL